MRERESVSSVSSASNVSSIQRTIDACKASGGKALVTFVTGGYPSMDFTAAVVEKMIDSGADVVEIGVPFTDPLADGPTIQAANMAAIYSGATVQGILGVVGTVRRDGYRSPIVLLVYTNSIYRYGTSRFLDECSEAGVDGLVVPDLPVEERAAFLNGTLDASKETGHVSDETRHSSDATRDASGPTHDASDVDSGGRPVLIPLVAPTTAADRIADIVSGCGGFVYCISTTGVTGVRRVLPEHLEELTAAIRARTHLPVCIGFGVGSGEDARAVCAHADGVIVGSAIVERIPRDAGTPGTEAFDSALSAVGRFVASLKSAIMRP